MAVIPSILVGRTWGSAVATAAWHLSGGTTLAQIGPDIAATVVAAPSADINFIGNVCIKFRGTRYMLDNSLLAATIRIRRYNAYSNSWDIVHTFQVGAVNLCLGIFPYQEANGVSGLFTVYFNTTAALNIAKTTDGVNWNSSPIGSITAISTGAIGRAHMHRNKLIFSTTASTNATSWNIADPVGLSVSVVTAVSDGTIPVNSGLNCQCAYATFNNRLFMLFTRAIATATTVAVASNGVNVNTFVGAQTLNVVTTTGFPAAGTLNVVTGSGLQIVTYTGGGGGGTTFTGCTSAGAGVLATGGAVVSGNVAQAQLYELVGGVWASLVGMGVNSVASVLAVLNTGSHVLLPIGSTKMVAIIKTDIGSLGGVIGAGTRGYDLTPSGATFTSSEVTLTLIPATLQNGGGAGTAGQRWTGFIDDVTIPGTPAVFAFLLSDDLAAGTVSYYEYANSSTFLAPGSLGTNANILLPYCVNGGGAYIAAAGDLDVWATQLAGVLAGTRFTYQAAGLIAGASQRMSVHAATTGILPFTPTSGGPAGIGHTLTGTGFNLLPAQDGVAVFVGMRLLVKNQVAGSDNGIYTLTQQGNGSSLQYILTRAVDFDQAAEVYHGAWVRVGEGGIVNGNLNFMLTTANPIVVDTTALVFTSAVPSANLLHRGSCRAATAGTLPAYTAAGSGASHTLTANAVGVLTVDTVALVLGDRVVVQHHAADNGIYSVTTEGTAGVAFVLTRVTGAAVVGLAGMIPGIYTYVAAGAGVNGNQFFEMTTDGQLVMETTAFAFTARLPVEWKMFYNTSENTNMSQGTLFGTATGGDALRATNLISRVSPDGVEPFTADWRAGSGGDGLQSGQAISAFQRLNV